VGRRYVCAEGVRPSQHREQDRLQPEKGLWPAVGGGTPLDLWVVPEFGLVCPGQRVL